MSRKAKWEQVGEIGVDAGLVWVGDPCYCVTPDADSHPAKTWDEFCELLYPSGDDVHSAPVCKQFNYAAGHAGLGVCVSTLDGDGTYPVFVKRDERGGIVGVMVRFD